MNKVLFFLIINAMTISLFSQNHVFNPDGKKHFTLEDIEINFYPEDSVMIPVKSGIELAPAIISSLPTLVNMGFKLTTSILEKRVKNFSNEFTRSQSYLEAGSKKIPKITFKRKISFEGTKPNVVALEIEVVPYKVEMTDGFIYSVDKIDLKYSSAKFRKKDYGIDYTIEIKPTFLVDNQKITTETSPIFISSVEFGEGKNIYKDKKHRSDIIIMPKGAFLTEVSLKIVESNPAKVRAEKILSTWNSYSDSTKTIINNFLPKKDETRGNGNTPAGGGNTQTQSNSGTNQPQAAGNSQQPGSGIIQKK